MTDLITVTGVVGSDPRAIVTGQQLPITSFRLASSRRYFNRATNTWEDAGTNWYTVSAFRNLAFNANASLRKGEHVVVHGRLKQRPWQAGDKSGIAIEIEADAIGHDLTWGITQVQRLEQQPRRPEVVGEGDSGATATSEDAAGQPADEGVASARADAPVDGLGSLLAELEGDEDGDVLDDVDDDAAGAASSGIAAFAS